MFNLLPNREQRIIRRQYRMRKLILMLGFVSFIAFSSLIFLIPSYVLTIYKVDETELQIDIVKRALNSKDQELLEQQINDLNESIKLVALDQQRLQFYDLTQRVLADKPRGVHVTGFLVQDNSVSDKQQTYRIQMTGISDTRNALVDYKDTLEKSGLYSEVNLPIESLASQFNTAFNLNLILSL